MKYLHLELLGREFHDGKKRSFFWDGNHLEHERINMSPHQTDAISSPYFKAKLSAKIVRKDCQ